MKTSWVGSPKLITGLMSGLIVMSLSSLVQAGDSVSITNFNLNMNVDTNRAVGNGAGNIPVTGTILSFNDSGTSYASGAGRAITLTVNPGFIFAPAATITVNSATIGINDNPPGIPTLIHPRGDANETLTLRLTSGTTPGTDSVSMTGMGFLIIDPAAAQQNQILKVSSVSAGGGFNNSPAISRTLVAGAADHLRITAQPVSSITAGQTIAASVQVEDFCNQRVSNLAGVPGASISAQLISNPPGEILFGTLSKPAAGGVVSWQAPDQLAVQKSGLGYQLQFQAGFPCWTSPTVLSDPFDVVGGPAFSAIFKTQPSDIVAGGPITASVQLLDQFGNAAGAPLNTPFLLNLFSGPAGGSLVLPAAVKIANGVEATWDAQDNVTLLTAGVYQLQAFSSLGSAAISAPFNVAPGLPAQLIFVQQPVTTPHKTPMTPEVQVEMQDQYGNRTPSADSVTLSLMGNPCNGTILNTSAPATTGQAVFPLVIDKPCVNYTLKASLPSVPDATSNSFNVTVGTDLEAGAVTVNADESKTLVTVNYGVLGNTSVPNFAVQIGLDEGPNPDGVVDLVLDTLPAGNPLLGTSVGAHSFTRDVGSALRGRAIDGGQILIRLDADSAVTEVDENNNLAATGPISFAGPLGPGVALRFVQQPTNNETNTLMTEPVSVEVVDTLGRRTKDAVPVTLSFQTNDCGGTLTGGSATSANGITYFDDLRISGVCNGYRLIATCSTFTAAISLPFNITPPTNLAMGAVGVSLDKTSAAVAFGYTVQGSATVPPFTIQIGLDKGPTPDGVIDTVLATIPASDADVGRAPGTYVLTRDISNLAGLAATGDRVIVRLDPADAVAESSDTDNARSSASLTVVADTPATTPPSGSGTPSTPSPSGSGTPTETEPDGDETPAGQGTPVVTTAAPCGAGMTAALAGSLVGLNLMRRRRW